MIDQLSDRLGPVGRERFLARLNMKRISAAKVRRRIYEKIFQVFISRAWVLLFALLAAIGSSAVLLVAGTGTARNVGAAMGASGVTGLALKLFAAVRKVHSEPAGISLADLVDIPDYSGQTSFVRQVDVDMKRALDLLPEERLVVIFIDDLDRCSPAKVAQVMEAVNLFLAGEYGRCAFIVGMDAEIVAASLQSAYEKVAGHLPPEVGNHLGWSFMGKFIQLPFLLPPVASSDLGRYADGLTATVASRPSLLMRTPNQHPEGGHMKSRNEQNNSPPTEDSQPLRPRRDGDAPLTGAGDEPIPFGTSKEFPYLVRQQAARFSRNPRELKRFVNALRFQYFLLWERLPQTGHEVTLDQLTRWVVFTLGWPQTVAWVWRNPAMAPDRLRSLEKIACEADDFPDWVKRALDLLGADPAQSAWSKDPDLFDFFRRESKLLEFERLSAAIEGGLW